VEPDILARKIQEHLEDKALLQVLDNLGQNGPEDECIQGENILRGISLDEILSESVPTESGGAESGRAESSGVDLNDFDLDDFEWDTLGSDGSENDSDEKVTAQLQAVVSDREAEKEAQCFHKYRLFERFGNDEELIQVVLEAFCQEAPDLIENMKTAIDQKDAELLRSYAHALKGSAANVNADILKETALAMEQDANQGDLVSASRILPDIEKEFNAFTREAIL